MVQLANNEAVLHVRFDGRSLDVPLEALDLGPKPGDASLKRALAGHLGVSAAELNDYVVDRHATGNLTVRPVAVFG